MVTGEMEVMASPELELTPAPFVLHFFFFLVFSLSPSL
jgi:hypothetical protein